MKNHGNDSMDAMLVDHTTVSRRAYERFARRGYAHGNALEDWLAAEAELRTEALRAATARVMEPVAAEPPAAAAPPAVEAAPVAPRAPAKKTTTPKRRRK